MKIRATISNSGEIILSENQTAYLQKNAGKQIYCSIDERTNTEKVAFFEIIVKYFFYQHNIGVFRDFSDARYSLKKMIGHTEFKINPNGELEETVRSMSEIYESNTKTTQAIEKCDEYFRENGFQFPDSEHFKNFKDTNVDKGASEYPPIISLIEKYNQNKEDNIPPWHRK